MEKEKIKSKYNEWQTVGFVLRTAWEIREKKVIFIMLSLVALNVGQNLVGIFITPGILAALERRASLGELCLTILGFVGVTMLLQGLSTYASRNWGFGLITVRSAILGKIVHKCGNTSYQNVLVKDFDKKKIDTSLAWFIGAGFEFDISNTGWSMGFETRYNSFRYDTEKLVHNAPSGITGHGNRHMSYMSLHMQVNKRF